MAKGLKATQEVAPIHNHVQNSNILDNVYHAFAGFGYALRTQLSIRIQLGLVGLALLLAFVLGLDPLGFAVLILALAFVITAELFNTVAEVIVDMITTEYHPLAKIAKDMAAGAVLVAVFAASVVALILLVPLVFARFQ